MDPVEETPAEDMADLLHSFVYDNFNEGDERFEEPEGVQVLAGTKWETYFFDTRYRGDLLRVQVSHLT